MKVILLKDIPKIGKKFEVKNVADGYVMNFLIPRGLVVFASDKELAKIEQMKIKNSAEEKIQEDLLYKSLDTLKSSTIKIKGKANEKGHLFAGISKDDLISEISKQLHLNLSPDFVVLEKPIKEVGDHKIQIKALGKKVELLVSIEAE